MTSLRTIPVATARRVAISRQHLSGTPRPDPDSRTMLEAVRDLGCLQLDPISVVARSHSLVLWSRLGNYDPARFEHLHWNERALFEYWAHCASIVLTEEYPIHATMMRRFARNNSRASDSESAWSQRTAAWLEENKALRDHILQHLEKNGPTASAKFEDISDRDWDSSGWTSGRNVSRMLDFLWMEGRIMVAGRSGIQKLWDLSERVLPEWTPQDELDDYELTRFAMQKSLRALGVAAPTHIRNNYIRGRYPQFKAVLAEFESDGTMQKVEVEDEGRKLPGPWYVHRDDLPLLEALQNSGWSPRTTLLSPFDNLICDRKRCETLFGFNFRIEIYTPKAQRKYGYYVLPILHGDRLIGRIDPMMDRKSGTLTVNAVYAEPDAPDDEATSRAVASAISDLALFLGANKIKYGGEMPDAWKPALAA